MTPVLLSGWAYVALLVAVIASVVVTVLFWKAVIRLIVSVDGLTQFAISEKKILLDNTKYNTVMDKLFNLRQLIIAIRGAEKREHKHPMIEFKKGLPIKISSAEKDFEKSLIKFRKLVDESYARAVKANKK